MKAILSDIHSNLEALQAVLADIAALKVEEIYCLGDVVGYGPNPRECIDLAMNFKLTLLGNHDQAVLFDPKDFNPVAERATFWTRKQLEAPVRSRHDADRRWEFLAELPTTFQDGDVLFVHGSARNPINEYVFPEDIYNPRKLERIFPLVKRCCFQGHTHLPGIFTEDKRFLSPEEAGLTYTLNDIKTLCNVGSVGQPRDGDWRACYVLLDGDTIRYRRVAYDVEATVKKIHAVPDLDKFLGDRLRKGR
jgi:diadenosine tetraphosphatase ApaH/serine/threonine PP2A family protein phosphatase